LNGSNVADPTFIFGGGQNYSQREHCLTVTLSRPTCLSRLAAATSPWDRSSSSIMFEVSNGGECYYADGEVPCEKGDSGSWHDHGRRGGVRTTCINVPAVYRGTPWRYVRYKVRGEAYREPRVYCVFALEDVMWQACKWKVGDPRAAWASTQVMELVVLFKRAIGRRPTNTLLALLPIAWLARRP
jgi:hypothetical protein